MNKDKFGRHNQIAFFIIFLLAIIISGCKRDNENTNVNIGSYAPNFALTDLSKKAINLDYYCQKKNNEESNLIMPAEFIFIHLYPAFEIFFIFSISEFIKFLSCSVIFNPSPLL